MKFAINIGGLKYNIDSITEKFYLVHGKKFECEYSNDAFDIVVTKDSLTSFRFYDSSLDIYNNEVSYILDAVIRHCLDYNRMVIHGAALSYKNDAYLFIAPSGVGKTTHIKLWKKHLENEVTIINGDKPMLEFSNDIIVHGTPWNGKENLGSNVSYPLKAIIVLKQASKNSITKLNTNDSIMNIMPQCFYAFDKEYASKVVSYIEKLINEIPIYQLECDMSDDAFKVCFESLK